MQFGGGNLRANGHQKKRRKDCGADGVTKVKGHGKSISSRFPQGRRRNFYEPKGEGDHRHFVFHLVSLPIFANQPNSGSKR